MFPRSTHDTFAQKLYQTFKNHKRFCKPKLARSDFTICHYAGNIGKTKVFLRAGQMAELDGRRTEVLGRSASIIQRKVCSYMARRNFSVLRCYVTRQYRYNLCTEILNITKETKRILPQS